MESQKRRHSLDGDVALQLPKRIQESWIGLLGGNIGVRSSQNAREMARTLFDSTVNNVRKDDAKRRFGNDWALRKMDQFDDLIRDVGQLKKCVEELKAESIVLRKTREDILELRRQVLGWRDSRSSELSIDDLKEREKRNDVAHGGNISVDSVLLEDMRQKATLEPAKYSDLLAVYEDNFKYLYCLGDHITTDMIANASASVAHVYDLRANVKVMNRWRYAGKNEDLAGKTTGKTNKKLAEDIKVKCDRVVDQWEAWRTSFKIGPERDVDGPAEEIQQLYDSFLFEIKKKRSEGEGGGREA